MSDTTTQTLRVSSPREVLAAITYQLGFHPTDSLVVASLQGESRRLGLIARVDLLAADQAAHALATHLAHDGAHAAIVVTYSDDMDQAHDAAAFMETALDATGIDRAGTWWVNGTEYRVIDPQRPQNCPTNGQALDIDTTTVATAWVTEGAAVAATRDDLGITPAKKEARDAAAAAAAAWTLEQTPTGRTDALGLWRQALTSEHTPQTAGRLAIALTDVLVRDAILCDMIGDADVANDIASGTTVTGISATLAKMLDPSTGIAPDAETTRPAADLLAHTAAHTTSPAALTLLAIMAWWAGNGARANIYVDAALTADPHYRLALLLSHALAAGMPPGWVRNR